MFTNIFKIIPTLYEIVWVSYLFVIIESQNLGALTEIATDSLITTLPSSRNTNSFLLVASFIYLFIFIKDQLVNIFCSMGRQCLLQLLSWC